MKETIIIIGDLQVWPEDLGKMTWEEAKESCASLSNGWRLPTLAEFKKTLYPDRSGIPNTDSNYYWSSTDYDYDTNTMWIFHFLNGKASLTNKHNTYYVRPVRDFTGEIALDLLLKEF